MMASTHVSVVYVLVLVLLLLYALNVEEKPSSGDHRETTRKTNLARRRSSETNHIYHRETQNATEGSFHDDFYYTPAR